MSQVLNKNDAILLAKQKLKENELNEAYSIYELILKKFPYDKYVLKQLIKIKKKIQNNNNFINLEISDVNINKKLNCLFIEQKYNEIIELYNYKKKSLNHVALNIIATAFKSLQNYKKSIEVYSKSIDLVSNFWPSLFNRGLVYFELRNFQKAHDDFLKANQIKNNNHQICFSLGSALEKLGKFDEAFKYYKKTMKIKDDFEPAYISLSDLYSQKNSYEKALEILDKLVTLNATNSIAFYNRGNVLQNLSRFDEAIISYDKAIEINPSLYQGFLNAGIIINKIFKNHKLAEEYIIKSLKIKHDNVQAISNYSALLSDTGRFQEAYNEANKAIELDKTYSVAFYNKGIALSGLGYIYEAIENYNRCICLDNNFVDCYFNKGLNSILLKNFDDGFNLYEFRKKRSKWQKRTFTNKELEDKSQIKGSTIYLYSEQGLGDTIHFARYAKAFVDYGAQVILEVQRPLLGLISEYPGLNIISKNDYTPEADFNLPLMSCPKILETDISNIPPLTRLNICKSDNEYWEEKIGKTGIRIGIAWQGSKGHEDDNKVQKLQRSFPIESLVNNINLPDVRLISLQKENNFIATNLQNSIETLGDDFDKTGYAFRDSVAVMQNLDLVITCDTSIAHLAGSLNIPTWIALKYIPDWRWLLGRDDSPWYPSIKLFRQPQWGDWDSVFKEMKKELIKQK